MQYSTRIEQWKVSEPQGEELKSPNDVYNNILKDKFNPIQEEMYVIGVNTQNKVLDCFMIAKGGYNALYCTPKEVFYPLVQTGAVKFFIAHNHPSGDITPSEEDREFTKKLESASKILGIQLLDHIIFDSKEFFSFRGNGMIK